MVEEALLDEIRQLLPQVRIPSHYDKVYKDECQFSFDTPLSKGGLYINLSTHQAFGKNFVSLDFQKTHQKLYLHEKWNKVLLSEKELEKYEAPPEKLAIGCEGGFHINKPKTKIDKVFALVVYPENIEIPLPCEELPLVLTEAISKIQSKQGSSNEERAAVWEGDEKFVSKYSENLEQLPADRKISSDPKQWKCEESGVTENLWMNLSTGFIGSGRRYFDGSGGNGAALRHYKATGSKYPLVVKLGTITPRGADVYSYAADEDCLVLDPYLDRHLSHWGINMMNMEKTEKTMVELQVELNLKHEFNKITEAGSELIPAYGPKLIGLVNLGNTCYMNSVLQVLWSLDGLKEKYVNEAYRIFGCCNGEPYNDVLVQMAKLGVALCEGKTGKEQDDSTDLSEENSEIWSVSPLTFKTLIGKGHPDFSTGQMQDAVEYFLYLMGLLEKTEKNTAASILPNRTLTASYFTFNLENRLLYSEDNKVSYHRQKQLLLPLDVALEATTNMGEVKDYEEREMKRQKLKESTANNNSGNNESSESVPIPQSPAEKVPFDACLSKMVNEELIENVFSESLGKQTSVYKTTRFVNFPSFLIIQLKRYVVDNNWHPKKIDATIMMPMRLNLEQLRSKGPQPGEDIVDVKKEDVEMEIGGIKPNSDIVSQLVGMGFGENGCKRAAIETNNESVESALNWILAHMDDDNFNQPIQNSVIRNVTVIKDEDIDAILSMGFSRQSAEAALIANSDNVQLAANWLLGNMDQLESETQRILKEAAQANATDREGKEQKEEEVLDDGKGVYDLVGFISHIGSSTMCGHYVCHILKEGRWVIFNDEKVAISELPPFGYGYMYMYKRVEE